MCSSIIADLPTVEGAVVVFPEERCDRGHTDQPVIAIAAVSGGMLPLCRLGAGRTVLKYPFDAEPPWIQASEDGCPVGDMTSYTVCRDAVRTTFG